MQLNQSTDCMCLSLEHRPEQRAHLIYPPPCNFLLNGLLLELNIALSSLILGQQWLVVPERNNNNDYSLGQRLQDVLLQRQQWLPTGMTEATKSGLELDPVSDLIHGFEHCQGALQAV